MSLAPPSDADLRPTAYLDFDHERVRAFVAEHAGDDALASMARAARLFTAVRDGVRYDPYASDLTPTGLAASAALERGRAFCVPKAILYAATLRAVGIPARLGFADVSNHLATQRLLDLLRTTVFAFHGYVLVWNGADWLKATPAFDRTLCTYFGVPPLEFDGTADAMLQAADGRGRAFMEYLKDRGVYDDFPFDTMMAAWREVYPHFFGDAPPVIDGDFRGEAERGGD